MDKEIAKLMRKAKKQGWRVEVTRKSHIKFLSPFGGIVIASGTPSEHRGLLNLKSRLKARGFVK
jgi:predicted RNA binding protein YcfA (HicA-like mRNA interferase family)